MHKKRIVLLAVSIIIVLFMTVIGYNLINSKDKNGDVDNNKVIEELKDISINIYGKDDVGVIYTKNIETNKQYLVEILENIPETKIVVEEGPYGAYITSIMDIKQEDGYYWSYYINGNYATEGISSCKIEDNTVYDFKIEKF